MASLSSADTFPVTATIGVETPRLRIASVVSIPPIVGITPSINMISYGEALARLSWTLRKASKPSAAWSITAYHDFSIETSIFLFISESSTTNAFGVLITAISTYFVCGSDSCFCDKLGGVSTDRPESDFDPSPPLFSLALTRETLEILVDSNISSSCCKRRGLVAIELTPASIIRVRSTGNTLPVTAIIGARTPSALIAAVASTPSITGITLSMNMMS
mmetsp:Transcript_20496/g.29421  ORF Transcript_20496/g.29421 Transcript_20496/m.29421 type:complete len:219 (-) Transcript_20496:2032-2688(-)